MSKEMVKTEEQTPERVSERQTIPPRVDLYENDDELLLIADIPGVDRKHLTVEVHDGTLSLEGKRGATNGGSGTEVSPPDYARRFALPNGIDVEKITAEVNAGVLRLRLPKAAALKPRQIQITAG